VCDLQEELPRRNWNELRAVEVASLRLVLWLPPVLVVSKYPHDCERGARWGPHGLPDHLAGVGAGALSRLDTKAKLTAGPPRPLGPPWWRGKKHNRRQGNTTQDRLAVAAMLRLRTRATRLRYGDRWEAWKFGASTQATCPPMQYSSGICSTMTTWRPSVITNRCFNIP